MLHLLIPPCRDLLFLLRFICVTKLHMICIASVTAACLLLQHLPQLLAKMNTHLDQPALLVSFLQDEAEPPASLLDIDCQFSVTHRVLNIIRTLGLLTISIGQMLHNTVAVLTYHKGGIKYNLACPPHICSLSSSLQTCQD